MAGFDNVTVKDAKAKALRGKGRNGDTEIAHVTPGEKVVPISLQTPRVNRVLNEEFERAGVPIERYTVGTTANSRNPETGQGEYFLSGIKNGLKKIVSAAPSIAAGFATGGPAGAAIAAGGALLGESGASAGGGDYAGGGGQSSGSPVMNSARTGSTGSTRPRLSNIGANTQSLKIADTSNPFGNAGYTALPTDGGYESSMGDGLSDGGSDIEGIISNLIDQMIPSRNGETGMQEFYDIPNRRNGGMTSMRRSSRNPRTGMQEFADPSLPSGFNADTYYKLNPDVKAAGVDAAQHYLTYGAKENRQTGAAAPAANPMNSISPTGLSVADNQAAKRRANYTGGFDDVNEWQDFARKNPENYLSYVQEGVSKNPNFKPNVDFDLVTPGVQTFAKPLNQALGKTITGYSGQTGTGQLGSGQKGIDILTLPQNQQYQNQYARTRAILDPGYKYTMNDVLPSDFNEADYLKMNPGVAAQVNAGQYTSGGHYYNTVGKNQGQAYKPEAVQEPDAGMQALLARIAALEAGNSQSEQQAAQNAVMSRPSTLSPVRVPRFRSRRYRGTVAENF